MASDFRKLIKWAKSNGWELLPRPKSGHDIIRYKETGDIVTLPHSPTDHRALQNCAADIKRLSGSKPFAPHKKKDKR